MAYNSVNKKFDLVYLNGQTDPPVDELSQDSSHHKKSDSDSEVDAFSAKAEEAPAVTDTMKQQSSKARRKKDFVVDLSRFGDDPNPDDMNSPEKRKFGEILICKNSEVLNRVSQALNQVVKVRNDIK